MDTAKEVMYTAAVILGLLSLYIMMTACAERIAGTYTTHERPHGTFKVCENGRCQERTVR